MLSNIFITPWFRHSIVQGTWAIGVSSTNIRNAYYYNSSGTDGDGVLYKEYMDAGTYTCKVTYHKNTNRGIFKVKIDGSAILTQDGYGAAENNLVTTQAGIAVASTGVKDITIVVDGKNGSSSSYALVFSSIEFYRTA